ncbi:MAG: hypothetical protein R3F11_14120 [Verrucomicrobiales bacterium]
MPSTRAFLEMVDSSECSIRQLRRCPRGGTGGVEHDALTYGNSWVTNGLSPDYFARSVSGKPGLRLRPRHL